MTRTEIIASLEKGSHVFATTVFDTNIEIVHYAEKNDQFGWTDHRGELNWIHSNTLVSLISAVLN